MNKMETALGCFGGARNIYCCIVTAKPNAVLLSLMQFIKSAPRNEINQQIFKNILFCSRFDNKIKQVMCPSIGFKEE